MTREEMFVSLIEGMPSFDGRYSNLCCINNYANPIPNKRQGQFSVVFSATDDVTDERVIIKVYDPFRPSKFRMDCFEREGEVLQELIDKNRCLQLKKAINTTDVQLPVTPSPIDISLSYFATEILPVDIFEKFNQKGSMPIDDKIDLFREILLGIRALHMHKVYHRDLKPDNLRGEEKDNRVIAIDLGTAVLPKTVHVLSSYEKVQVGHPSYASPEACCGLYGHRELSIYNDYYSLGCIMFELFTPNTLYLELHKKRITDIISLCEFQMASEPESTKISKWHEIAHYYTNRLDYPTLSDYPNDISKSIINYLERILHGFIRFDYRERINIDEALRLIDICIKIRSNDKFEKELQKRHQVYRLNRIAKIIKMNTKYLSAGECHD